MNNISFSSYDGFHNYQVHRVFFYCSLLPAPCSLLPLLPITHYPDLVQMFCISDMLPSLLPAPYFMLKKYNIFSLSEKIN
ncbi:hypothetical protein [Moorena sp. SIO4G3]|uniref:hypothetical protein n=1 Tax=Moorena sp. SIO4G3 TaxID=2607821 RepID=UPI00142B2ECC|nr:hypothetical protein [Moorena sp. SIO4G3]NEO78711.1 hypothetical protein [Moorena sp. SIO4G3]